MIIQFQRFKEMHNPSIREMQDFVRDSGWKNFTACWDRWLTESVVVLERLPCKSD